MGMTGRVIHPAVGLDLDDPTRTASDGENCTHEIGCDLDRRTGQQRARNGLEIGGSHHETGTASPKAARTASGVIIGTSPPCGTDT